MEHETDILNRLHIPYSQIPNSIFKMERTSNQKLTLLYLCRCANQGANAFPSYNKIGLNCSFSRSTAIRIISQLVKLGDLIKYPRSRTSNLYTINLPDVMLTPDSESLTSDSEIPPGVTQTPPSSTVTPPSSTVTPYKEPSIKNHSIKNHLNNDLFAKAEKVYDYYFKKYLDVTGKPHPTLKPEQQAGVLREIALKDTEFGGNGFELLEDSDWQTLVDAHFQRDLDTDWNINHFASGKIIELLYYKCLY